MAGISRKRDANRHVRYCNTPHEQGGDNHRYLYENQVTNDRWRKQGRRGEWLKNPPNEGGPNSGR